MSGTYCIPDGRMLSEPMCVAFRYIAAVIHPEQDRSENYKERKLLRGKSNGDENGKIYSRSSNKRDGGD